MKFVLFLRIQLVRYIFKGIISIPLVSTQTYVVVIHQSQLQVWSQVFPLTLTLQFHDYLSCRQA